MSGLSLTNTKSLNDRKKNELRAHTILKLVYMMFFIRALIYQQVMLSLNLFEYLQINVLLWLKHS